MATEEKLTYDSRKKELHRKIVETGEGGKAMGIGDVKKCSYKIVNEQTYGEDAIKKVYGELKRQRDDLNKTLSSSNQTLDACKDLEDDASLKELKEQLNKLQMLEKKYKAEEQHKYALENLQTVNKQLNELKKAVGNHVKLG